jgi:hypothetical protein
VADDLSPPRRLRLNGVVYDVERVEDIRPADPEQHNCPEGWLLVSIVAYNEEIDETTTVQLVIPPRSDDPSQPDYTRWHPPKGD